MQNNSENAKAQTLQLRKKWSAVMKSRTRFLLSHVFLLGCICLGVAHILYMTTRYFKFETNTRITLDKKQQIEAPTLVVCVKFKEVLDYNTLSKKRGQLIGMESSLADELTIREIFQLTPPEDEMLKGCTYRHRRDKRVMLVLEDNTNCTFFRMTKFIMQSFVCYSMMPRWRPTYAIDNLASSYNFEHTIYVVDWDPLFMNAQTLLVILADNQLPYRSRIFGSTKMITSSTKEHVTDVIVRNKMTRVKLLEKPFDTECSNSYTMQDNTFCLINKMRKHNLSRIPATEIITTPYDLKQVQISDERNKTIRTLLDRIYDECSAETDGEKCEYTISETDARFYESDNNTYMTFRVMSPMAANSLIMSRKSFPFSDYALYICSCFGIWFGISIQDLDPVRVWPKIRKRLHRCYKIVPVPVEASEWILATPVTQVHTFPERPASKKETASAIKERVTAARK